MAATEYYFKDKIAQKQFNDLTAEIAKHTAKADGFSAEGKELLAAAEKGHVKDKETELKAILSNPDLCYTEKEWSDITNRLNDLRNSKTADVPVIEHIGNEEVMTYVLDYVEANRVLAKSAEQQAQLDELRAAKEEIAEEYDKYEAAEKSLTKETVEFGEAQGMMEQGLAEASTNAMAINVLSKDEYTEALDRITHPIKTTIDTWKNTHSLYIAPIDAGIIAGKKLGDGAKVLGDNASKGLDKASDTAMRKSVGFRHTVSAAVNTALTSISFAANAVRKAPEEVAKGCVSTAKALAATAKSTLKKTTALLNNMARETKLMARSLAKETDRFLDWASMGAHSKMGMGMASAFDPIRDRVCNSLGITKEEYWKNEIHDFNWGDKSPVEKAGDAIKEKAAESKSMLLSTGEKIANAAHGMKNRAIGVGLLINTGFLEMKLAAAKGIEKAYDMAVTMYQKEVEKYVGWYKDEEKRMTEATADKMAASMAYASGNTHFIATSEGVYAEAGDEQTKELAEKAAKNIKHADARIEKAQKEMKYLREGAADVGQKMEDAAVKRNKAQYRKMEIQNEIAEKRNQASVRLNGRDVESKEDRDEP